MFYLIYCTGNETWNIRSSIEDLRKHAAKTGRSLNSWKADFTDAVAI